MLVFVGCLTLSNPLFAQKASVKGRTVDSAQKKGLPYSTLSLIDAKDSSLVSINMADSSGSFSIQMDNPGDFLLSASHTGFMPLWKRVQLRKGETLDLENLRLRPVDTMVDITVTVRRPPVEIKDDVIEFNTEHFKTPPNALVEDMLKRMPGMTVDRNGMVRFNGKPVRRLMVNGKEIFSGNPTIATQNLNADWVDKVQVYERKSDRSQFTGLDDGYTETTVNLVLKKDKHRAIFGRASAGTGTNRRFEAHTNLNRFDNNRQLSLIGMGNNTDKNGFAMTELLSFNTELQKNLLNGTSGSFMVSSDELGLPVAGMGNKQGISKTFAGGLNINESWKKKTDFNASLLTSDIETKIESELLRKNLVPRDQFDYSSISTSERSTRQQRFKATIDHRMDSFNSIRITPQLSFQQDRQTALTRFASSSDDGLPLNEGSTENASQSGRMALNNDILFRKRFARQGRTLSSSINMGYSLTGTERSLATDNTFFSQGLSVLDTTVMQNNEAEGIFRSFQGSATYTEKVGRRILMELTGYHNRATGNSELNTMDYNGQTGKYDLPNTPLTNSFGMRQTANGGTLRFRGNFQKGSAGLSASVQEAGMTSEDRSSGTVVRHSFTDLLPTANLRYRFSSKASAILNYNSSTRMPSARQLQPVADVSDPLNVYKGNPDLRRSYVHTLNATFNDFNFARGRNLFAFASLNRIDDAIVQSDLVDAGGRRVSTSVNADGVINAFANLNSGISWKKLKSNIGVGIGVNYSRAMSFVNGNRNELRNLSLAPSLTWAFTLEDRLMLFASARWNFSKASYSLQPSLDNRFIQHTYTLEMTNQLPAGITLNNTLAYTMSSGLQQGFDTDVPLWSASFSKSLLKNDRGELKLTATDILNRNAGIGRTANHNFVEDMRYNVLKRYFLVSFLFVLNKNGKTPGVVLRSQN